MKRLASTALVAALVGCVTPRTDLPGSVTITQRPTYGICTGYCPNVDVSVRNDGRVTVSRHFLDEPDEIRHVQVGSAKAARLVQTLSRYRPKLGEAGPAGCGFWNTDDPLILKVYPYQITWVDRDGRTNQLRSCGGVADEHLREAIRTALGSMGLGMDGEPQG